MVMRRCDADEHHYDDSKHASCPYCRKTIPYVDEATRIRRAAPDAETRIRDEPEVAHTQVFGLDKAQVPVVGWLVVIAAPPDAAGRDNKGRDLRVVSGMNRVGRDPGMEIALDFGDPKIGRDTHCTITYDPESNAFYLQGGAGGRNLTYVRGEEGEGGGASWEVVLQPRRLEYLDSLRIGDTVLLFVPLCNERFKWNYDEAG